MKLLAAALAAAVLLVLLYGYAHGARTQAACWFAGGWLYATGLPTTYPYSVTSSPYPIGTTQWSTDGTYAGPTWVTAAYFWVRGHGPSLIKPGRQLNDYHLIAECHA